VGKRLLLLHVVVDGGRGAAADGAPAPPPPTPADPAAHLGKATADAQVVLVADIDMLADGVVVQIQESFGQQVRVPINGNLDFLQSLVEAFAGDSQLGGLRSRAAYCLPRWPARSGSSPERLAHRRRPNRRRPRRSRRAAPWAGISPSG
jgi:hypothetical protein